MSRATSGSAWDAPSNCYTRSIVFSETPHALPGRVQTQSMIAID